MKLLKTWEDSSYMPLWQEDLAFIQNNLIEVLTQMGKTFAFNATTYIISGCTLTEDSERYYVSEGLIMFAGELLYCPVQYADKASDLMPYLENGELFDANGDKIFLLSNGGNDTRQTWDVNYAKLVVIDPNAGGTRIPLATALSLPERVKSQIMPDTGWINVTLQNGWSAVGYGIKYRKYGNLLQLRGVINGSVSTGDKFATLPASYAPDVDIVIKRGDYTLTIKKDTAEIFCNSFEDFGLSDINWII